jgi:hypothetical protein
MQKEEKVTVCKEKKKKKKRCGQSVQLLNVKPVSASRNQ